MVPITRPQRVLITKGKWKNKIAFVEKELDETIGVVFSVFGMRTIYFLSKNDVKYLNDKEEERSVSLKEYRAAAK